MGGIGEDRTAHRWGSINSSVNLNGGVVKMGRIDAKTERRCNKRFKAAEGAFAALVNHHSKLGQIQNISTAGLSFSYIEDQGQPDDACELKIIIGHRGLYLDKIPFRQIFDFEIDNPYSFSSIKMRQIGLQFGELTAEQQNRLHDFIRKHTVGEV